MIVKLYTSHASRVQNRIVQYITSVNYFYPCQQAFLLLSSEYNISRLTFPTAGVNALCDVV